MESNRELDKTGYEFSSEKQLETKFFDNTIDALLWWEFWRNTAPDYHYKVMILNLWKYNEIIGVFRGKDIDTLLNKIINYEANRL